MEEKVVNPLIEAKRVNTGNSYKFNIIQWKVEEKFISLMEVYDVKSI